MDAIVAMPVLHTTWHISEYCTENEIAFVAAYIEVAATDEQNLLLPGRSLCGIIRARLERHAPETHAALGALHPMGHMGEMSDIVNAILFLDAVHHR
jgi:hypothetical protein